MKKIQQRFKVHYKEGNHGLKLSDFILFEMALMVVKKYKSDAPANKGYILFSKYHVIGGMNKEEDPFFLQMAALRLQKYRSKKIWEDTLKEYEKDEYAGLRLYETAGECIQKNRKENLEYGNREQDYIRIILENPGYKKKPLKIEKKPKITITYEELIETAEEMQKINPKDYCIHVLKNNLMKEIKDGKIQRAEALEINQVVNIVGMVGAGKSTLLKILGYYFHKHNKRMVIVVDTVAATFHLYEYFAELGCKVSPLIGKSDRKKYINQMLEEDAFYLKEEISRYLTPGCLIDGMNLEEEKAISFGKEPCIQLKRGKAPQICPYYDRCNNTRMERQALENNIVITTMAGLALRRVGKENRIFLEEVIAHFDLVCYDECDKVQQTVDQMFVPAADFDSFIQAGAEECKRFMSCSNHERMKDRLYASYIELRCDSMAIERSVVEAIRDLQNSGDKRSLSTTFSAVTLLNRIEDRISKETKEEIYKLMRSPSYTSRELASLLEFSYKEKNKQQFANAFDLWLDMREPQLILEKIPENDKNLKEKEEIKKRNQEKVIIRKTLILIIKLINFDQYVLNLSYAYEALEEFDTEYHELLGFVRSRFTAQQEYLPSAPMGNLFGIQITEQNNIILFRQYAYGRAMITNLHNLRCDKNGNPLGPHVILLSGSSYAKGALEYHINAKVNYIIEANHAVREFISKTKFIELGIEDRVSGCSLDKKEEILRKVVNKITDIVMKQLQEEGKIMLVVNSFSQAKVVAEQLQMNFLHEDCKEKVCALLPDAAQGEDHPDHFIRRGEVYKFDSHRARVLVAPALSIERGHNIVDENGHSTINSIFLMIRPLGVPDDIQHQAVKLNGYIDEMLFHNQISDVFDRNLIVRKVANVFWHRLQKQYYSLSHISDEVIKKDIVAMLFILIIQIFGRMCRITDESKNPPKVYFVDGAFRPVITAEGKASGFDTLEALGNYMDELMNDPEHGDIARTLYEPFFKAYKGGITWQKEE